MSSLKDLIPDCTQTTSAELRDKRHYINSPDAAEKQPNCGKTHPILFQYKPLSSAEFTSVI